MKLQAFNTVNFSKEGTKTKNSKFSILLLDFRLFCKKIKFHIYKIYPKGHVLVIARAIATNESKIMDGACRITQFLGALGGGERRRRGNDVTQLPATICTFPRQNYHTKFVNNISALFIVGGN